MTRRGADAKAAAAGERIKAGTDMLQDPALHRAIIEYANGRIDAANQILKDSQTWANWVKQQPIPGQERLNAVLGIVYLDLEEEETEE